MAICCAKNRSGNFCPECGKSLGKGLASLLHHIRTHQEPISRRLASWKEKHPGDDCPHLETALQKWKSWGDRLEELMKQLEIQE